MEKPDQLRVAAAQMIFAPTIAGNLAKIETAIARAARRKVDAVLFPECATTGYAFDFATLNREEIGEALALVGGFARRHGTHVLIGSPVFGGGKLFNCLVVFDRKGRAGHCYAKCQLTDGDRRFFAPGDAISLFKLDGVTCTSVICHERRYPELVRLGAMAGAQVLFHPNAGMDAPSASKRKRGGRDGIATRAFENAIYYVFANSVGPQGGGKWSAGDSKIVAPDLRMLQLADNRSESLIVADLDLSQATRKYAEDSRVHPRFLSRHWREILRELKARARDGVKGFELP